MTTKKEKSKIIDFIFNFRKIAQKENWVTIYDKGVDSLSIIKPVLSNSSRINYINDEFALYLNNKKDVEGIFIEYFFNNFIKHHKEVDLKLTEIEGNEGDLIELKDKQEEKIVPKLEKIVKDSLVDDIQFKQMNK